MNHPPKIPWFSGTDLKSGNATYELWRQEVKCLMEQSYDRDAILNAVRRSSRGEPGMVAMRRDLNANIDDIIRKLNRIYGSVDKKEILLSEFYGSRQKNYDNEIMIMFPTGVVGWKELLCFMMLYLTPPREQSLRKLK
jgi:hypothetical protein